MMTPRRQGRLFWKFFFAFWTAQLLTSIGVGVAVWWRHSEHISDLEQRMSISTPVVPLGNHHWIDTRSTPVLPFSTQGGHHWMRPPLLLRDPLVPLLTGGLVSFVFAWGLAWYFSRPIGSLRQAFDAAAQGNLDLRIGDRLAKRGDELSDLGQDFDHMATRLQSLLHSQQRLLHDVSHELRSPLARLQAALDLVAQQPERTPEFMARIEREALRMDQLVGELLTLARLDSGTQAYRKEALDLAEIIDSVVEDAAFEGKQRQCHVRAHGDTPVQLQGNRELLHRALENVVRNALKHSPQGGQIDIEIEEDTAQRQVIIGIHDEGQGVPTADLDRIFEPFTRSTGGNAFAGYGLGLAITQRVMHWHGGHVSASNRQPHGLSVRLQFPLP